ncbi:uncharacterized protein LOC110179085 [Drosophila serrata]|uniref:uncharacterized protein LOC110179085 n=1 Tax=Drosophila serrata TaxID=7274 RepID=UPI000A1D0176|nr:uncharacterized protein LOC110179085 [Drosophila serrata]
MTSILDMKSGPPDYWAEISNFFLPLKYLITNERFDALVRDIDLFYLINGVFWIFVAMSCGFCGFQRLFQFFLKSSNMKYFKRKQFARVIWNIAFYGASCLFLHFYNEFILLPQLMKNQGRYSLFYSSENVIFYRSNQTEKFQFYSIFIITFYLHGAMLDFKEADFLEVGSKGLYLLSLIAIDVYRYENYFVGLNLTVGLYSILTEVLALLVLPSSYSHRIVYQVFLGLQIAAWAHVFVNLVPFKYLIPTLFAKNFKLPLNVAIWFWYGISIWNSPVLQCFYHQIYHTSPSDCSGDGSAAKCIMVKDSSEFRHYKTLKKAYLEVKLAHERINAQSLSTHETSSASAKTFQAIKCVMMLKRKLKRIREGRGHEPEDDTEDMTTTDA